MYRSVRVGLAAVVLTAVAAVAAPAPAQARTSASAGVEPGAVAQLAADWGVDLDEAAARVARQDDVAALAQALEGAAGDAYGGVWIDHADGGRVAVGLTGGSTEVVDTLAREHGLADVVRVDKVLYGLTELGAVADRLADGLAAANAGARTAVSVGLRTDLNAVEMELPDDATAAQRAYVAEAQRTYGAAVAVSIGDGRVDVAACTSPTACDKPLQGGVHIHAGNGLTCTGAFNVKSGGAKWMLTAGHCLYYAGFNPWQYWWTRNSNGINRKFGGGGQIWWFGGANGRDFAAITVDYAAENPQPTIFANASGRLINGTASAVFGQYLCKTGQTTGYRCGYVTSTNYNTTYPGGIPVKNMIKAGIYTCKGDSGGPNYLNNKAYGITSGMTDTVSSNCGNSVITGKIGTALAVLGMSLL